jgi:uncharacterized protein YgiM (DUF1202 family)
MSVETGFLVRVIADYDAPFTDPIRVQSGEEVAIDRGKTTNISGWLWCTSKAGKSGWVPEAFLDLSASLGYMECDYDAIELTVRVGDQLTVHGMESGFYWVTDFHGRQGWVPVEHVERIILEKGSEK